MVYGEGGSVGRGKRAAQMVSACYKWGGGGGGRAREGLFTRMGKGGGGGRRRQSVRG